MLVDASLLVAVGLFAATSGFIIGAWWAYRMVIRTIGEAMVVTGKIKKQLSGAAKMGFKDMIFSAGAEVLPELIRDGMKSRGKVK